MSYSTYMYCDVVKFKRYLIYHKVDVHNFSFSLKKASLIKRCTIRCESKNKHERFHVLERNWNTCSNFVHHFRPDSQYNWGGPLLVTLIERYKIMTNTIHFGVRGEGWGWGWGGDYVSQKGRKRDL